MELSSLSFFKSISVITGINIFGVFIALINTMIVAHYFGTTREIEIFFSTNVLLYVVMKLSQSGEMSEILLPIYHKIKYEISLEQAQRVISSVLNWYVLGLLLISVVMFILSPWLVSIIVPGFSHSEQALGVQMIRAITPLFVIIFLNGQIQTLINAEKLFGIPEAISVTGRGIVIVVILIGHRYYGVWIMVISLWISTVTSFFLLSFFYYKAGNRHYFQLVDKEFSLTPIIKQIWSTLPYVGTTQLWAIIFNAGLSKLPEGTLAIFTYSRTLVLKLSAVFLRPMSLVFFSYYSDENSKSKKNLKVLTNKALEYIPLIVVPSIVVLMISGESILTFLWHGDKFDIDSIRLSMKIIIVLVSMLLIEGVYIIARKIVISLGYVKPTYTLMSICQLSAAFFAWYAIQHLGLLGAVSSIIFNMLLLTSVPFLILMRYEKQHLFFYKFSFSMKWLFTGGSTYMIISIFSVYSLNQLDMEIDRLNLLLQAGVITLLVILISFSFAALLNISSARQIGHRIIKKL